MWPLIKLFSTHNLLIRYTLRAAIRKRASRYLRGKVIDVGCGSKQYESLLAGYVSEHIGLDHPETLHDKTKVDIFGTIYAIPQDDGVFDGLLCTEVLEHVEDPLGGLRECERVLKAGGYAIFTCPFIWHLHEEPRDFYRYSKYGLRYLFDTAGFDIVEIAPLGGFWITFGQLFSYAIHRYNKGPIRYFPVIPLVGVIAQGIGLLLHTLSPRPEWASHYIAVVQKRSCDGGKA